MKKWLFVVSMAFCLMGNGLFAQVIKGTYAIKNVKTGLLLRPEEARKANGTAIVGYSPVNWKCMTWDFQHVGGETYQLKNLFTGKTLQPVGGVTTEGARLEQQPLVPSQLTQEYDFLPAGVGKYRIRLKGTDLFLTPSNTSGAVNESIVLAKKHDSPDQLWTIYEQAPTQ
ncbi:RICIN domain-containing protein [Fibrella sp. HMF5335]|uniref:RICIN domain-containing protein n=1 Tax=Fibrella rubiginis TaxID=2817060 RepID=A0A939K704_9BACT|nr:RICIN domain-containing protein [Fibrella rubiginis]MBO0938110.1 RICIN domain-containing protein [Fibrella rubiginis]